MSSQYGREGGGGGGGRGCVGESRRHRADLPGGVECKDFLEVHSVSLRLLHCHDAPEPGHGRQRKLQNTVKSVRY